MEAHIASRSKFDESDYFTRAVAAPFDMETAALIHLASMAKGNLQVEQDFLAGQTVPSLILEQGDSNQTSPREGAEPRLWNVSIQKGDIAN